MYFFESTSRHSSVRAGEAMISCSFYPWYVPLNQDSTEQPPHIHAYPVQELDLSYDLDLLHNLLCLLSYRCEVWYWSPCHRHPTSRYSQGPVLLVPLRNILCHNNALYPTLNRCLPPPNMRQATTQVHRLLHLPGHDRLHHLLLLSCHLPMPADDLLLGTV